MESNNTAINIEITEKHRDVYLSFYRKRKKYHCLGCHIENNSRLKIIDDLVKLGYLVYIFTKDSKRVRYNGELVIDTYKYYKSTNKKLPTRKFETKKLKKLYDINGVEATLTYCEKPKNLRGRWEYETIKINNKEYDTEIHVGDYCDVIYFQFEDKRWYKFKKIAELDYTELWQFGKEKWERINKLSNIFSE